MAAKPLTTTPHLDAMTDALTVLADLLTAVDEKQNEAAAQSKPGTSPPPPKTCEVSGCTELISTRSKIYVDGTQIKSPVCQRHRRHLLKKYVLKQDGNNLTAEMLRSEIATMGAR